MPIAMAISKLSDFKPIQLSFFRYSMRIELTDFLLSKRNFVIIFHRGDIVGHCTVRIEDSSVTSAFDTCFRESNGRPGGNARFALLCLEPQIQRASSLRALEHR